MLKTTANNVKNLYNKYDNQLEIVKNQNMITHAKNAEILNLSEHALNPDILQHS